MYLYRIPIPLWASHETSWCSARGEDPGLEPEPEEKLGRRGLKKKEKILFNLATTPGPGKTRRADARGDETERNNQTSKT